MEEVKKWVEQLQRAYKEDELQQEVDNINRLISEDEFKTYFKNKDESTKSSPSGRHIGHYKAILDDDDLVSNITAMLNIGLIAGTALERWKQTLSVKLEKDPRSPKLDRLCIIQLFEADYNFLLAVLFGHWLMGFARRHCSLNKSQYGNMNGKQAQSTVLNKILTYDYFRLTKENAATAEFDATANYDRILPALVVITCRQLGLGKQAGDILFDSLANLKHQIQTTYGITDEYCSTLEHTLFGTGQGSSGSPMFWALIAGALFNSMDANGHGLVLSNPNGSNVSRKNKDGYVDDTSLGVDG